MKSRNEFTLTEPCSNCPFRTDLTFYLDASRINEIADALENQLTFNCHKTTYFTDDGEVDIGPKTRACAGARAVMANEGRSMQMERISERLGIRVADLKPDAPVDDSIEDWRRRMLEVSGG